MNAFRRQKDIGRKRAGGAGRLPLNYYRSADGRAAASPFQKAPAKSASKIQKGRRLLIYLVLLAAVIFGLIYSLLVQPSPKLILNSQAYHPAGVYRAVAVDRLKSVKNRSKISFNDQGVINSLESKFPEVAKASLELPILSQTPTIRLNISPPSLFLNNGGQRFVVDSQGVAVAKAGELPQIQDLALVTDQSGFAARAGKAALSAKGVNFIKGLAANCQKQKITIASLTLPAKPGELDLRAGDQGYYVKFFLNGDAAQQIGQFLAARHQFAASGPQPSEYLDVRVPGKIFYK